MRRQTRLLAVYLSLVAAALTACGGGGSEPAQGLPTASPYVYTVPDAIGDGWQVANVADEGLDEDGDGLFDDDTFIRHFHLLELELTDLGELGTWCFAGDGAGAGGDMIR